MPAAFVLGGLALLARADSKTELQALLALPLSPGSVALLAQHATDPAVHRRYEYPASARRAGREGVVILEALIGVEGCVRDLRVLKSAGSELDLESLLAMSRWRYEPARLNGRPVPVYLTVTSTFKLHR